ncbi:hypothetical protein SNEBB_001278 [Seison nebaliae]|nr:hypothetical protein SNEBB_001278 [Seison nebaliae]
MSAEKFEYFLFIITVANSVHVKFDSQSKTQNILYGIHKHDEECLRTRNLFGNHVLVNRTCTSHNHRSFTLIIPETLIFNVLKVKGNEVVPNQGIFKLQYL